MTGGKKMTKRKLTRAQRIALDQRRRGDEPHRRTIRGKRLGGDPFMLKLLKRLGHQQGKW